MSHDSCDMNLPIYFYDKEWKSFDIKCMLFINFPKNKNFLKISKMLNCPFLEKKKKKTCFN